jgi:hypothetical protein
MNDRFEAWPELSPDAAAMDRVTALMISGVEAVQTEAAEPGESQFRLLSGLWAAVAFGGYLAWNLLSGWFRLHPIGTAVLIAVACLSVVAPLVLVPILRDRERPAPNEGGTALC